MTNVFKGQSGQLYCLDCGEYRKRNRTLEGELDVLKLTITRIKNYGEFVRLQRNVLIKGWEAKKVKDEKQENCN